jgi:hypothetical protein
MIRHASGMGRCEGRSMNDLTGEWFTYRQAGELLNVSPAAVRHRAVRGRWQRTLGNDKRTRVRLPEDWKATVRPADSRPRKRVRVERVPAKRMIDTLRSHVDALQSHVETLRAQLETAEARIAQQAVDFAAREARLSADLSVERTLAEHLTSRVDKMTTDLGVEKARRVKLEHELDEASQRWWRPRAR